MFTERFCSDINVKIKNVLELFWGLEDKRKYFIDGKDIRNTLIICRPKDHVELILENISSFEDTIIWTDEIVYLYFKNIRRLDGLKLVGGRFSISSEIDGEYKVGLKNVVAKCFSIDFLSCKTAYLDGFTFEGNKLCSGFLEEVYGLDGLNFKGKLLLFDKFLNKNE